MKKVLVAAAGLMLVGTMASTAMAEFYFSGDARTRFYYQDNYNIRGINGIPTEDTFTDETNWKSRIRVNVKAETKGGAYAISRIRLGNGTWDGGDSGTTSVDVDRAYIGVPFGPVTVEGGRQYRDITPFMYYGTDVDGIDVNYKTDKTTVVAFYDMYDEENNALYSDDIDMGGVVLKQEFEGGWGLLVAGAYGSTSQESNGFIGDVQLTGALGSVSLTAEVGYQEDNSGLDSIYSTDDGWGGYVSAAMPIGPANVMAMVGGTTDGFTWDQGDFGPFEMIGDVNIINTAFNPSEFGETWFVVVNPTFQATEALTLGAVFAYIPTDAYGVDIEDADLMEISGRATYAVTDGAKLIGVVGYLDTDDLTDDDPFGVGVSLEIAF